MSGVKLLAGTALAVIAVAGSLWAAPVAAAATSSGQADLQVLLVSGDNQLFHAMRVTSTGAWNGFNPVAPVATVPAGVTAPAAAGFGGSLHAFVLSGASGDIAQAVRLPDGRWQGFDAVPAPDGQPAQFFGIRAAGTRTALQTFVIQGDEATGGMLRSQSTGGQAGPAWGAWSAPFPLSAVAPAAADRDLHLLVLSRGVLSHAILFGGGDMTQFADVGNWSAVPASIQSVAAAVAGGDLHVMLLDASGRLYHAVRFARTGAWTGFVDVSGWAHVPGRVVSVSAAGIGSDLQVVVTSGGSLYHAVRSTTSGAWNGFNNVAGWATVPAVLDSPTAVSAAAV
jgi:hypothetical protein